MRSSKRTKNQHGIAGNPIATLAYCLLLLLVVLVVPAPARAAGGSAKGVTSSLDNLGASNAPAFGAKAVFNKANTNRPSASALSSNKFAVAYPDGGNSDHGTAMIGNVSGSIATYGSKAVFNNAATDYTYAAALSASKFVVAYRDVGNSKYGTAVVGDVSGNAITFGSEVVFNAASADFISVSALSSSKFVVAYRDDDNSYNGTAVIGDVSGNTITFGSEQVFNAASTDYTCVSALSSSKFVVAYCDVGMGNLEYGTALIGDVSGNTITFGSEKVFNAAATDFISVSALSASKFVAAYRDVGNLEYGTAVIGDVSGNTITFGSEKVFNAGSNDFNSVSALSASRFVVAYCDDANSFTGTAVICDVSGDAITSSSEGYFNEGGTGYYICTSRLSDSKFVIAYQDVNNSYYGTAVIGSTVLKSSTWYLAEGSTAWGFSSYITIQNPNTTSVKADVIYMRTGNTPVTVPNVNLPANSQTTLNPRDTIGDADFSTKVVCKNPDMNIAVDRTMTWTGAGAAGEEGHSSVGVTSPRTKWYLPEGSSDWGFECWLLIQNPDAVNEAHCTVTYMVGDEGPNSVVKTIPPHTRQSFDMAKDIGYKDASIRVTSDVPVIPERSMYRNNRREGHDSIGTTTAASDYYLAEGTTAWGFTTYVLIQNPNTTSTNVTVTYMTTSGPKPQAFFNMKANSRKTIRVNDVAGMANSDFSTAVHGSKPIIAERAMYWDNGTGEACHDSIGMDQAHTTFYLPDGQTSEGRETFTLVQNPNSSAVSVQVSYLKAGGGIVSFTASIPANSRKTFNMADKVAAGRASIMVTSKTAGKRIMVERAMYWNNRGAGTDTIGGYSDEG